MRVAVVGAGVIGLSIAKSLAAAGHDVAAFDQAQVPNPYASSVDRSRLIRHTYGRQQLGYAAMVDAAYAAWDRLWAELGEIHYQQTGTLVLAQPGATWADDCAGTLAELDRPVQWLDRDALAARYPLLDTRGVDHAFLAESGGVLQAERIVAALAKRLRDLGGTLHEETQVARADPDAGRLTLVDGAMVEADLLVLAPGPWAGRLLPDLAGELTPSRQLACYAEPPASRRDAWAGMPMVLDIGKDSGFYAVPPVFGAPVKLGDHSFTLRGDPDREREPGDDELRQLFDAARTRLADSDGYRLLDGRTCFYTVAANEQFVVRRLDKAVVLAGFSGHGFKFGPLIGERFAEVAAGDLDEVVFARWAAGEGG